MDKPSGLSEVFATWVLQQQMVWSLPLDEQGQSWGKESCSSGKNRMLEPELPPRSSGPQDTNKKTKTQKEEITLPRSHGSHNTTSCSHLLGTYYISYRYISILLILVLPKTTFQGRYYCLWFIERIWKPREAKWLARGLPVEHKARFPAHTWLLLSEVRPCFDGIVRMLDFPYLIYGGHVAVVVS